MNRRKKLIILSFFIMILIVVLVIYITRIENGTTDDSPLKQNIEEVVNQGGSVLKYGDNVYLIDELTDSIIKYNSKDSSANIVADYETDIGNKLHIISNQLLHFVNGNTYYLDLSGRQIKKFSTGEVVYINDEIYLYIVKKSSMEYLYITSYDNKTFRGTSDINYTLARGNNIEFLKQSDESLFFTSRNSDESITLFEVDLKNYKTTVITRQTPVSNDVNGKVSFCDVIKTDDNYFYVIDNIIKTTYSEFINNSYLWKRPINGSFEEVYKELKGRSLVLNSKNTSEMIYEDYDSENKVYELISNEDSSVKYNWLDFLYGDVTRYFTFENLTIYMNGEKLTYMDNEYSNYSINKVIRGKEGLYILFQHGLIHDWFFVKEDGSSIVKIYSFN